MLCSRCFVLGEVREGKVVLGGVGDSSWVAMDGLGGDVGRGGGSRHPNKDIRFRLGVITQFSPCRALSLSRAYKDKVRRYNNNGRWISNRLRWVPSYRC